MKKRIFAILMAVIMVTSLVIGAIPAMAAEESDTITIRFHYHRDDGNYEGWEMWFWDPDAISELNPPYGFEADENGDMVATIQVKTGTTRVGYIVRYGEWVTKDVDYDQFINITGILSGTVDFYVESGKPTQPSTDKTPSMEKLVEDGVMVLGDDVVQGVVITNSGYKASNRNGQPEITLQMSSALSYEPTLETFKISNADTEVAIESMRGAGQYVYLVLAEPLDLARAYNVTFEGRDYALSMPDFYSSEEFESQFTYEGNDLGATYTSESTFLRLWAPTAVEVYVNLYNNGDPSVEKTPIDQIPMTKDVNGTWICTLKGDYNGTYYTYEVHLDTKTVEACDPYARTTGVNGDRAMIIDLASTNPKGWDNDSNPNAGMKYTDAIIYELHVRDLSADSSAGISNVGKYLGLIETGTKTPSGIPTGLDHMVDLGITHLHLLPVYDINSVNETKINEEGAKIYNWGYDPKNYNVPEGSYSTDPYNGEVRVKEFKQMVKGLHDAGISVIMDVVYNHVADSNNFCVNKITPGYFSRPDSNGSGCGNDTASERNMVRKYIVDSVNYWADEYHIDGFRFDLVGLLDTQTINEIVETVHAKHPDVIFYGEGWSMGTKVTKTGYQMATMFNSTKMPGFAFFSDTVRNLIKGGTYGGVNKGFISGGSTNTVDMENCFKGMPDWCTTPSQSINYISCHDNNTLFDHISIVLPNASLEEKASMNKLGAAFILTAQGIPFFQAGEEFLRSKPDDTKADGFNENSYNAGDEINSIKWSDLDKDVYMNVYNYYKGLIAFRKAHPALRLDNGADVDANVTRINNLPASVYGYNIAGGVNGETSDGIIAVFNGSNASATVTLPAGNWNIYINGEKAGTEVLGSVSGSVEVPAVSAMVLVKEDAVVNPPVVDPTEPEATQPEASQPAENAGSEQKSEENNGLLIGIIIAVVVVAIAAVVFVVIKKKN